VFFSIPSPSSDAIHIGPLRFTAYGFCIAVGVAIAVTVASRRWVRNGGHPSDMGAIATWAVPAGVIGARLYHLATDWKSYRGHWWPDAAKLWDGGLGVWGGIGLGVVVGLVVARKRGLPLPTMLDMVAPAIPLAQAAGRWGNWFNQELFGRPTTLPWALEISPANRPARFRNFATFHPTFLYESLWNVLVAIVVVLVERRTRGRWKGGRLFALYVAMYTFMRFFIERIRVDNAYRLAGLRINEWVSGVIFLIATAFLLRPRRRGDLAVGSVDQTVANPAQ
jgi:prolipoprotein diacylglyceryl transferase